MRVGREEVSESGRCYVTVIGVAWFREKRQRVEKNKD